MIVMDGKKLSLKKRESIIERVKKLKVKGKKVVLATLAVSPAKPSLSYIKSREKVFKYVGIDTVTEIFNDNVEENTLIELIERWNGEEDIDGILVELPLPEKFNTLKILSHISPDKDVDCLNPESLGLLLYNKPKFLPATPAGIIMLMKEYSIPIESKKVVIMGRGRTVGRPLSIILSSKNPSYGNATVTLCHSRTFNLPEISSKADIIITAMGKPEMVDQRYVREGAVVIDAGINVIETNGRRKIVGDVNFDSIKDKVYAITPVPGGVGPMTVTALMENVVVSAEKRYG